MTAGEGTEPGVALSVEGLTKRYGSLVAVDDLSLQVYEGEVFGLLGPNGAGKTTTISMMCGLLKPDAGRVVIDGVVARGSDADVRSRVGVCPQEVVLWQKLTCLQQLTFVGEMYGVAAKEARVRGVRLLQDMGLVEKTNSLAATLSGGMKRRLNLALALVHDPVILVLDEPEAGLDPQSRVMVRDYIRSLARRKTVIVTTHNMDEADRIADRVAIVDHGKLLALDTPEALKRSVGGGDVLEIDLAADLADFGERAQAAVAFLGERATATVAGHKLFVRALDAVALLPEVIYALTEAGCVPGEVRVRQSSLEDVFIQMTGKGLRA